MPVVPCAFWYLHIKQNSTWCNELRSYFQSTMESLFSHFDLLIWLDDMLDYCARTLDRLLASLKAVFEICMEKGLNLNPRKCDFVAAYVHFCGLLTDSKRVKFHPRQYEALTSMKAPTTVAALMSSCTALTGF